MSVISRTLQTPRLLTHFLDTGGGGQTVVFVHGNVSSSEFFEPLMLSLSGDSRVRLVAPDLRGFGRSEDKPIDATRGVRDFSDDLHSLLTTLEGVSDKVVLCGWSVGGAVVMQYAVDHPERVAGLVLEAPMSPYGFGGTRDTVGTPCFPDFAGSGGGTANPTFVQQLRAGDRGDSSDFSPRKVMNGFYYKPPFHVAAELEDRFVDAMVAIRTGDDHYPGDIKTSPNWPGIAPGARGMNNALSPAYVNLAAFASVSPQPKVLWIRGKDDQIVSDNSLFDLSFLGQLGAVPGWPGAEVCPPQPMLGQTRAVLTAFRERGGSFEEVVLDNCAHSPHIEKEAEFRAHLQQFLLSL